MITNTNQLLFTFVHPVGVKGQITQSYLPMVQVSGLGSGTRRDLLWRPRGVPTQAPSPSFMGFC